jgi:hypothetical protein
MGAASESSITPDHCPVRREAEQSEQAALSSFSHSSIYLLKNALPSTGQTPAN